MAEILLYGIIGDPIDELDAATITAAIRASSGPLAVRINSPGGFVMEGLAIVAALRAYADPITIYIDGLPASMASVIAMVGADIVMAESALLMIHKPWDSAIGDAVELRACADMLDKIETQMIGIYAQRTGLAAPALAAMLDAETWFTAEEALAAGFVTSIAAPLRLAAMARATGYGFRHLPDRLKQQDPEMTDAAAAIAEDRTRVASILALADKHRLPSAMAQTLIERGTPLTDARASILDYLATESDRHQIGHMFAHGNQTLDNPATYAGAMTDALVAKISGKPATGPATEFQGMTVVDMARDFLSRAGRRDATRLSPDRVLNAALETRGGGARGWNYSTPSAGGGLHTTSDFPDLIGGASEKYLIERYKLQESALKQLARQRDLPDFLVHYGVQAGTMGALDPVNEAGEFKNRTTQTRKEGYAIKTYGNIFSVSRQLLVNDSLGALSDILAVMAAEAAETEATVLAALINSNILMGDQQPWFSTPHGNLAAAPATPAIETLDIGRQAMRQQKDIDGVHLIDANPKYLVVPVQLQTAAEVLVASTIAPTNVGEVNPFAGKLQVVSDPRLTSPTAWYMFADPNFTPALQYSYLDGHSAPFLDQQQGWRVDGTEYKVRHDFGAGVMDYRMAWKNAGA